MRLSYLLHVSRAAGSDALWTAPGFGAPDLAGATFRMPKGGIFSGISRPQNASRVNPTPGRAPSRLAVGIVVYAAYDRRLVDYLRALTVVSYGTFLDAGLHVLSDSIAMC